MICSTLEATRAAWKVCNYTYSHPASSTRYDFVLVEALHYLVLKPSVGNYPKIIRMVEDLITDMEKNS